MKYLVRKYSLLSLTKILIVYIYICQHRGVRGAVWFGFKHNNHPNRERKKHAVWFGSVDF
ncbi:hypothetical protein MTR_5g066150 [Medicago truncatula]|uniref:Uncharacterized protein n=1 Tax=Medicago truncatula TaxID=3880 RepID=G7KBL0_MEDTR|nr:hypothetical protein MTR_5g066150 [Medicago truncatula]